MSDQPRQLDPKNPQDAILVIDQLTADMSMTRKQAFMFQIALQTIHTALTPAQDPTKE